MTEKMIEALLDECVKAFKAFLLEDTKETRSALVKARSDFRKAARRHVLPQAAE